MQRRILTIAVCVGVILALAVGATLWPAATFAQKPTESTAIEKPATSKEDHPTKAKTELDRLLAEDPERAAEEFVNRTSAEARDAVEKLSKEAEELRARLQKVKAALGRLQTVLHALETPEEPAYQPTPMPVFRSGN